MTPLERLKQRIRDNAASRFSFDPAEHPRGGFPQNAGEFSPKGAAGAVQSDAVKAPHEMSSKEFYGAYPYQHSLISAADPATVRSIETQGFRRGFNVNAIPATKGPPTDVIQKQYGTRAGVRVVAIPKHAAKDGRNGPVVNEGHKPTPDEHVVPASDYEPLHEALVRQALASGKSVPEGVLREYPHLNPDKEAVARQKAAEEAAVQKKVLAYAKKTGRDLETAWLIVAGRRMPGTSPHPPAPGEPNPAE